jgi:hypothetical protein
MTLRPEDVRKAIASGKNQKLADGRSLYLYVKNAHGFWGINSLTMVRPKPTRRRTRTRGANV